MLAGDLATGLLAVAASFLAAGQVPLEALQLALSRPVVTRRGRALAIAGDGKILQANIDTDHWLKGRLNPLRQHNVADQRDVPFPRRILGEGGTFERPFRLPVQDEPNFADLRHEQSVTTERETLRDTEGELAPFPPLEAWELCPLLEEVDVGSIQVTERLLQRLRVHQA
jgi:hypothetical protein